MAFKFGTQKSLGLGIIGGGAILKPQDVFAILAQPANAMQAAINSLPFSPDIFIGKDRVAAGDWSWRDSLTGLNNTLASNTTAAQAAWPGYSGTNNRIEYAFKQQAGVIWRVTWTGDGTSNRQIPHGLGVVPGMVIVKRRSTGSFWYVYHASTGFGKSLYLNRTDAVSTYSGEWPSANTATAISIGTDINTAGETFVAYLFAHDPSADGIVQCGSMAGPTATVTLGWPPQFLLFKKTDSAEQWFIIDTARGWRSTGSDPSLSPNNSDAELSAVEFGNPTATGFQANNLGTGSYIYLAIRAPY